MKYDIYFHNDFDGRACAALMLSFLRSRGDDIEHFTPVSYELLPQWRNEKFFSKHKLWEGKRNPVIVVDFLYHPAATFWFDHHPTTFKKEIWQKKFKQTKYRRMEPKYPSCTHLVYDSLKKGFGWKPPKHLTELVKWLDVIDAAKYKSAKQTIEMKEPALQIDAYIYKTEHDEKSRRWLVDLLARNPITKIARIPEIKRTVDAFRKKNAEGVDFFLKNVKVFPNGTFIDFTKTNLRPPKFIANSVFPDLSYTVRLMPREGLYHVGASGNPWLPFNPKVHIGDLLKKYGGGGHKQVGGVEFKTLKEAQRAAREIITYLEKR